MIQPVECFLDRLIPRNVVAGFVDYAALVLVRSSEEAENWLLLGLHGEEEIEVAIQH